MIKWRHISEFNEENTLPMFIYSNSNKLYRLSINYITNDEVEIIYKLESTIRSDVLYSEIFNIRNLMAIEIIDKVRLKLDELKCSPSDRLNFIQLIDNEVMRRLNTENEDIIDEVIDEYTDKNYEEDFLDLSIDKTHKAYSETSYTHTEGTNLDEEEYEFDLSN